MDAIAWGFVLHITEAQLLPRTKPMVLAAVTMISGVAAIILPIIGSGNFAIEAAFPFYAPAFGVIAVLTAVRFAKLIEQSQFLTEISEVLGHLSYSIYLFHLIVLTTIMSLSLGEAMQFGLWFLGTVAVAWLVFQAIETPVLRARPSYS
jgi:peptidoglycan/LPS O-acetylase OafA/YrhL